MAVDLALITLMMQWAVHFTHYPYPANLPRVTVVSQEEVERYCKCKGGGCAKISGCYNYQGVIFLTDKADEGVLLHEEVHYLQHLAGHSRACEQHIADEIEAYGAQQLYWVEGRGVRVQNPVPEMTCNADGGIHAEAHR